MELAMNSKFVEMNEQEMMEVDGGGVATYIKAALVDAVIIFTTGKSTAEHISDLMHAAVDSARNFSGPSPRMIAGRTRSSRRTKSSR